jgi:hypothetical protein
MTLELSVDELLYDHPLPSAAVRHPARPLSPTAERLHGEG